MLIFYWIKTTNNFVIDNLNFLFTYIYFLYDHKFIIRKFYA